MKQVVKSIKEKLFANRKNYYQNIKGIKKNISLDIGWGKMLFAQTYEQSSELLNELIQEEPEKRNLAFYIQEPQTLLYQGEGKIFLAPSFTYRLHLHHYTPTKLKSPICVRLLTKSDISGVNEVYKESDVLPIDFENIIKNQYSPAVTYFIAEENGVILGIITGVDHRELFNSPEGGASLWGLAVSPKARGKGIGKKLINYIAEHYKVKGRAYIDLSVFIENTKAISLYESMGFQKIPRFCIKCKNSINQGLYN